MSEKGRENWVELKKQQKGGIGKVSWKGKSESVDDPGVNEFLGSIKKVIREGGRKAITPCFVKEVDEKPPQMQVKR